MSDIQQSAFPSVSSNNVYPSVTETGAASAATTSATDTTGSYTESSFTAVKVKQEEDDDDDVMVIAGPDDVDSVGGLDMMSDSNMQGCQSALPELHAHGGDERHAGQDAKVNLLLAW